MAAPGATIRSLESPGGGRHGYAGLHRHLWAGVAPSDQVEVAVSGGEADPLMGTVDRPDAPAVDVDAPDPVEGSRGGDACVECLRHCKLDSWVLVEGHGPPRFESSKCNSRRHQVLGDADTPRLHLRYPPPAGSFGTSSEDAVVDHAEQSLNQVVGPLSLGPGECHVNIMPEEGRVTLPS